MVESTRLENRSGRDSPTAGQVRIGPLIQDGQADWTAPFQMTGGAAYTAVRELTGVESIARVFIDFHTIIVGDGIDPHVAHKAFLAIDEYAEHISPDIAGARDPEDEYQRGGGINRSRKGVSSCARSICRMRCATEVMVNGTFPAHKSG